MLEGSLTIGDQFLDYGGGNNWSTIASGSLLECLNHAEIAVHDNETRLANFMYFGGRRTNYNR